jgi:hypothetical protein
VEGKRVVVVVVVVVVVTIVIRKGVGQPRHQDVQATVARENDLRRCLLVDGSDARERW